MDEKPHIGHTATLDHLGSFNGAACGAQYCLDSTWCLQILEEIHHQRAEVISTALRQHPGAVGLLGLICAGTQLLVGQSLLAHLHN